MPGYLSFDDQHFWFAPIRGLRSISSRLFKKSTKQQELPDTSDQKEPLFKELLSAIISVKKEVRADIGIFDTDGLQITMTGGKTFRFSAVQKRDEAFSYILAHSARSLESFTQVT